MYKDKKILAIIPARGGSKGIPHKNKKLLNGKPLLQYTIEAALASKRLDRVIFSVKKLSLTKITSFMTSSCIRLLSKVNKTDSLF